MQQTNSFATASMVLGIISIVSVCLFGLTGGIAFPFSALAILLAFLSKGNSDRYLPNAKTGLITGIIGLIGNIVLYVAIIVVILTVPEFNTLFWDTYNNAYDSVIDDGEFYNYNEDYDYYEDYTYYEDNLYDYFNYGGEENTPSNLPFDL